MATVRPPAHERLSITNEVGTGRSHTTNHAKTIIIKMRDHLFLIPLPDKGKLFEIKREI